MKKKLDKRTLHRMIVTTLGRIERLQRAILEYSDDSLWTGIDWSTPAERAATAEQCRTQLVEQVRKLKHYNDLADEAISQ